MRVSHPAGLFAPSTSLSPRVTGIRFSELDLDPRTIDNVKMGYIFEELIRKFSENAEAGDHYTGRDIIKLMVNILLAEGCDDIFDDGKVITILEKTLPTLIQTNETKKSTQIDAFFESKPKIDAFLKIDANAKRQEYKMAS